MIVIVVLLYSYLRWKCMIARTQQDSLDVYRTTEVNRRIVAKSVDLCEGNRERRSISWDMKWAFETVATSPAKL